MGIKIAIGKTRIGTGVPVGGLLPSPASLTLTVLSDTSIKLDWISTYNVAVERGTDGINYVEIIVVAGGTNTYTDTGLTAGTHYYYRVRSTTADVTIPIPFFATDGKTLWYDFKDTANITLSSDLITGWADKYGYGINFPDMGVGKRPKLEADGVLFDGVAQGLQAGPFAAKALPMTVWLVCKTVAWSVGRVFYQMYNLNTGEFNMISASPYIKSGSTGWYTDTVAVDTFAVIENNFKNGAEYGRINNGSKITNGAGAVSGTLSYISLGAKTGTALWSNIKVKGFFIRFNDDSDDDKLVVGSYLKTYYGI